MSDPNDPTLPLPTDVDYSGSVTYDRGGFFAPVHAPADPALPPGVSPALDEAAALAGMQPGDPHDVGQLADMANALAAFQGPRR